MVDEDFDIIEVVRDEAGRVKTYLFGCADMIMRDELKTFEYYWEFYRYHVDNTVNVEHRYVLCANDLLNPPKIFCDHVDLYLDAERKVEKYSVCEDICPDEIGFYEPDYKWVIPDGR